MSDKYYTDERHIQILIYLMKAHNVKKIVASPGTTNLTLVGSLQNDPYFEIYSSVDERSAAYLACGLAAESGEAVALSCTGATASRNYLSGLTEAYYRKLPILAITSTQHRGRIEQYMPQVIDRSEQINDTVNMSKQIYQIHTEEDAWNTVVSINEALLELKHHGGGPVHLNVETTYSRNFSVKQLPPIRVIERITYSDAMPELSQGHIGIFIGAHEKMTAELADSIERFCEIYGAVVFCDQTSNYKGKYKVYPSLVCSQAQYVSQLRNLSVLIHIGSISGSDIAMNSKCDYKVWRVNPDGKVRDTFRKLKYVFEMKEIDFFKHYIALNISNRNTDYYQRWIQECKRIENRIPELPFSNVWIAKNTINKFPQGSTVYFAILNTLRCWNYFDAPEEITGYSNTGGFGIDGGLSTLIGSSFCNNDKLYFCITGDLGFFYDMNALGNRHVGNNLRIMVVNNGHGTEFTNYNHPGAAFGEDAKPFIAAAGHFGNQSKTLLKHYAEDLGFDYFSASSKDEYINLVERFVDVKEAKKAIVFEVFTEGANESEAIRIMRSLEVDPSTATKTTVKGIIGEKNYNTIKRIIKH